MGKGPRRSLPHVEDGGLNKADVLIQRLGGYVEWNAMLASVSSSLLVLLRRHLPDAMATSVVSCKPSMALMPSILAVYVFSRSKCVPASRPDPGKLHAALRAR